MGKLRAISNFKTIDEGEHIFRIYGVTHDELVGKIEVYMITAKGDTHREQFRIKVDKNTYNEKALGALSYFAKNVLNDFEIDEFDPMDFVNHYIKAEIVHNIVPDKNDPALNRTFAHISKKEPAEGFEEKPVEGVMEKTLLNTAKPKNTQAKPQKTETVGLDIDAILG